MSRKITLNSFIVFEPDKKRISGRGRTEVISASASLCLELLIDNAGQLVTHQEFYEYVWRRFGTEPASASLYHNISSLRRALKKTGLQEDIIRTMPRKGFLLSPQTTVDKETTPLPLSPVYVSGISAGDNETADKSTTEVRIQAAPDEKKTDAVDTTRLQSVRLKSRFYLSGFKSKKSLMLALLLVIPVLPVCFFYIMAGQNYNDELFTYSTDYKGCAIFNNSDSWLSQSEVKKQVDELNIVCDGNPYVYLTAYKHADSLSYFNCEHPLGGHVRANCRSYYYVKNKNND